MWLVDITCYVIRTSVHDAGCIYTYLMSDMLDVCTDAHNLSSEDSG